MPKYYLFDQYIPVDTQYTMEPDKFLIIEKIGTNSSTAAKLVIGGAEVGAINSTVAPLHKTSSNLLGPLDLGELYYVVPPNTKYKFTGASGSKMRLIGRIGVLSPGEAVPAAHMARYDQQNKIYLTYVEDTYNHGTDTAWVADAEAEVYSLTPKTTEKYIFNNICMVAGSGDTISEGDFAVRFYLDGKVLDLLAKTAGKLGIDVKSMPRPPAATTEETPFTLKDLPIEVLGDHTLSVKIRNISGSDKSPASGSQWSFTFTAIVRYEFGGGT